MSLNEWYEKGLTVKDYIQLLEHHKEGFEQIENNFILPNDEDFLNYLEKQKLRTIIIAEVWCGHCMLNIPIFLKLAQNTNIPVKILPRDENLELMDQYLTNGNRTIPKFIFIDEAGREIATWGPVAESTKKFVDQYRQELPEKDTPGYDEKFKTFINITSKAFREDPKLWNGVYNSMKETLLKI